MKRILFGPVGVLGCALVAVSPAAAAGHPIGPPVIVSSQPRQPAPAASGQPATSASTAATRFSISFVTAPGYQYAVAGRGWGSRRRVTFTLTAGDTLVIRLRTTRHGGFLVGINKVDRCQAVSVLVADAAMHENRVVRPGPMCPVHVAPTAYQPNLVVLKGKLLRR